MANATFEYMIFIRATTEQVWLGLLLPRYTRAYWAHENVSDWKPGSPWTHRRTDADRTVDIQGTVLESQPAKRLVLTWIPPADPTDVSRVTLQLAPESWPNGPWTCLRIVHSDLVADSEMHRSVSHGWPALASGLKTLLETGAVF